MRSASASVGLVCVPLATTEVLYLHRRNKNKNKEET